MFNTALYTVKVNNLKITVSLLVSVFMLITLSACTEGKETNIYYPKETSVNFVERYVNEVDSTTSINVYKSYWGNLANNYILNKPDRAALELENAAAMHALVKFDNSLRGLPEVNNWNDAANTVSLTFNLNTPSILSLKGYPNSGDAPWLQYQITIEKENEKWVVSGETLIR